jgi:lipid-A-disaccharide synthase
LRILISAGEASGEMYGAQLIEALRQAYIHVGTAAPGCPVERSSVAAARHNPAELRSAGQPRAAVPTKAEQLHFFGVGGERMRAAGCDTIIDAKDLSVVGITEILSHLPKIYGLFHKLIAEADKRRPDLALVIDSPAFNWRVAREMKKRGVPTVYYVAPQFWAWRQGRVRLLRSYIDKALVIFPFEEQFYRDRGVDATFVGHPLAELAPPAIARADYAAQFQLDPSKQWVTLMPGSRLKEVRMNLPAIIEAAARLEGDYEFLLPVAPILDRNFVRALVEQNVRAENKTEPPKITLVPESLPALCHSRVGVIASGTATVEAAVMGTPFVMVYRVSPLTYLLGKPRVKVPHFAMVNLIAGQEVVPELVQQDFTGQNVVAHLQEIIPDGPKRELMLQGLAKVKSRLKAPATTAEPPGSPADRAAEIIFSMLSW